MVSVWVVSFFPHACLTCAPELLAFHLADAFISQPPGVAAAGAAGLYRVVKQVVGQPLQVTVTHKGILGQVAGGEPESQQREVDHENGQWEPQIRITPCN